MEKRLLTVDEVAQALSWGRTATYAKVLAGEIPSIKLGKSRRVPVSALDEFVERLAAQAKDGDG